MFKFVGLKDLLQSDKIQVTEFLQPDWKHNIKETIQKNIETKRQDFIPNLREETFWELEEEYI